MTNAILAEIESNRANHECGWVGGCLCPRDQAPCECGHVNASHGSFRNGGFVGIGNGGCGNCECEKFQDDGGIVRL